MVQSRMPRAKRFISNKLQKTILVENMPICFNNPTEVVEDITKNHPELCTDLKKSLLKFMADVDKVSKKHSVPLALETYFVLTGGVTDGK